jgi:hypothetical protein
MQNVKGRPSSGGAQFIPLATDRMIANHFAKVKT